MKMTKRMAHAAYAALIVCLGSATALAGEVDGNGNPIPGGENGDDVPGRGVRG